MSRRAEVMFRFRHLLDEHRAEIAAAVSSEHGKVRSDAAGELARGIENVEFACGIPALLKGGFSEQAATDVDVHSVRQPLGVVAGITPFNFPAMVPLWMLTTAIACGNTFVLKPSEKDPSAALLLAELLAEAGLPDGVFNVVQGDAVAVNRILEHPDIAAVSFVGSTPIARHVYVTGTAHGKRVQALGGAKNHMVVLPDADIEVAADAAVSAAYGSAGERCMAVSVVVAVGDSADRIVDAISQRLPKLRIGPGERSRIGDGSAHHPRASRSRRVVPRDGGERRRARRRRRSRVRRSTATASSWACRSSTTCDRACSVYDDEIFGPVLAVVRADTYDEALRLVNDNPYGNGCAIFTRDGGAARQFEYDVICGMVGVNVPIPVPVSYYSFGGWKASLFGDTAMYGPAGVDFYTRTKVITSRWPDPATSAVDLGFPRTRC